MWWNIKEQLLSVYKSTNFANVSSSSSYMNEAISWLSKKKEKHILSIAHISQNHEFSGKHLRYHWMTSDWHCHCLCESWNCNVSSTFLSLMKKRKTLLRHARIWFVGKWLKFKMVQRKRSSLTSKDWIIQLTNDKIGFFPVLQRIHFFTLYQMSTFLGLLFGRPWLWLHKGHLKQHLLRVSPLQHSWW